MRPHPQGSMKGGDIEWWAPQTNKAQGRAKPCKPSDWREDSHRRNHWSQPSSLYPQPAAQPRKPPWGPQRRRPPAANSTAPTSRALRSPGGPPSQTPHRRTPPPPPLCTHTQSAVTNLPGVCIRSVVDRGFIPPEGTLTLGGVQLARHRLGPPPGGSPFPGVALSVRCSRCEKDFDKERI